jgi:hypothetical protein
LDDVFDAAQPGVGALCCGLVRCRGAAFESVELSDSVEHLYGVRGGSDVAVGDEEDSEALLLG